MYAACASAGRGAGPVALVRLTRSGPHPPARLCRPPFFKQKLRPVSGRRYSFLYSLIPLHHLLQHTIICSSDYGEGPSELTRHSCMHLHPRPGNPFAGGLLAFRPCNSGVIFEKRLPSASGSHHPRFAPAFLTSIYCLRQSLWSLIQFYEHFTPFSR